MYFLVFFFFQAEDGIRALYVTGVQTCALPISAEPRRRPDADQAVGASREAVPLERDRPDDLRESEREHREIDAREPHAEPAEDERTERRGERRQRQGERHWRAVPGSERSG